MQISATPLPGYAHIFQQYLQDTYECMHIRWDVKEALGVYASTMGCKRSFNCTHIPFIDITPLFQSRLYTMCIHLCMVKANGAHGHIKGFTQILTTVKEMASKISLIIQLPKTLINIRLNRKFSQGQCCWMKLMWFYLHTICV